jgi:hypothetical protein
MNLSRLLATILCSAAITTSQAQLIGVATPTGAHVPAALGGLPGAEVKFWVAQNGQYAVAHTSKEARVWRLPEGELVYRFQQGSNLGSVAWNVIKDVTVTEDGRYVYASGGSWNEHVLAPVDLSSGKALSAGPTLDSLKSGLYQMRLGARNFLELERKLQSTLTEPTSSPILQKRPYDYDYPKFIEGIRIEDAVRDASMPGSTLICFQQEYCQGGKWLKKALEKAGQDYKWHKKIVDNTGDCQLEDMHVVRYTPGSNKVEYLGPGVPGVERIDYKDINELHLSPFGDVVAVEFQNDYDNFHIYSLSGQELWTMAATDFLSFDDRGNVLLRRKEAGKVLVSKYKPLSGTEVLSYELPASMPDLRIIDGWGMAANIQKASDGNISISLHDQTTGRMMLALTDAEAAKSFTAQYANEVETLAREREERIRRNEEAWQRHQEQSQKAAAAANARETERYAANAAAAAEHAKYYQFCSKCGGSGGTYEQDYYTTNRTEVIAGGAHVGWQSVRTTTVKNYSPYKKFVPCTRCWGKGEVRK